jgi:hypothetical protein
MSTLSIITMIVILGFIAGGFIYFIILAMRKESENTSSAGPDSSANDV